LLKKTKFYFNKSFIEMGIDLKQGGRLLNKSKKESRTENVYLRLLIKVLGDIFSYILSYREEPRQNSTKWF